MTDGTAVGGLGPGVAQDAHGAPHGRRRLGRGPLDADIVAGRTAGRYHALPWVGKELTDVSCPTGLKAVAGAMITCTGKGGDGRDADIPVRVVRADSHSVTWTFQR
ncbi:DUF4333 domain-containing protein [Streptomyces iakyrus]|nr:DUF4333 domain-containing protein [Streptomyces iakyrus]